MSFAVPYLGHGLGLRSQHYSEFLTQPPPCPWLEVISENFMIAGGRPRRVLEKVRRDVPVVLHGVSLSIGSTDALNMDYLRQLKLLAAHVEPAWVSDHLCWGGYGGHYAHDLLPLPYTEEAVQHVAQRVRQVQDVLQRQMMLENVSSYVAFRDSTMTEWEFLTAIVEQADCGILLDVNNVHVSAVNQDFSAMAYLHGLPLDRVGQIHLAGHADKGTYLLDNHLGPTPDVVWDLYAAAVRRFGRVSTLVEWDEEVPDLATLTQEAGKAATIETAALTARHPDDLDLDRAVALDYP